MMDNPRHKQQPGVSPEQWRLMPGLEESVEVDPQALEQLEQQFLTGITKAKRLTKPRMTMSVGLRWALAGAMLFALVALGPLVTPQSSSLVAALYPGMQGQVLSAVDLSPVNSVQVWLEEFAPGEDGTLQSEGRELTAISDAGGFFNIPPGDLNNPREISLVHDGEEVASLTEDPGKQEFQGYQRFTIACSSEDISLDHAIALTPGASVNVTDAVWVSLREDATADWHGKLLIDQQWPAAFSYSRILNGVYSLEGAAISGLEIKVRLDDEVLSALHLKPEDVVLLTHNPEYELQDDCRGFHHGWYRASESPDQVNLPTISSRFTYDKNNHATLSWPAEPGVKYALQLPMQVEGKLDFVNFYEDGTETSDPPQQRLMLLDQQSPQLYAVYAFNRPSEDSEYYLENGQPRVHQPFYELANAKQCVKPKKDGKVIPFGQWRIQLLDFTLQEIHNFDIDAPTVLPEPGKFQLELTPGEVGGMSTVRVVGDLDRLAQPPAWSYGYDYVVRAFGEVVELPAPYPGSYKVQVTLREMNGAVSVLCGSIEVVDSDLPLYWPDAFNAVPALDCITSPPVKDTNVQAMTTTALANPLPYGYCVSTLAGPVWRCDLPDTFHDAPLRMVRIVQYASRIGGDIHTIEFQPELSLALSTQTGPMMQNASNFELPKVKQIDICNTNFSHVAREIVRFENRGREADVLRLLTSGTFFDQHVAPLRDQFPAKFGWSLDDLPPAERIIADARELYDSPAYGRRHVTETEQQLVWEFDLSGHEIPDGQDLLLRYSIETMGLLLAAQWELLSSPEHPSYIEVEVEGQTEPWRGYFDYSPLMTD